MLHKVRGSSLGKVATLSSKFYDLHLYVICFPIGKSYAKLSSSSMRKVWGWYSVHTNVQGGLKLLGVTSSWFASNTATKMRRGNFLHFFYRQPFANFCIYHWFTVWTAKAARYYTTSALLPVWVYATNDVERGESSFKGRYRDAVGAWILYKGELNGKSEWLAYLAKCSLSWFSTALW